MKNALRPIASASDSGHVLDQDSIILEYVFKSSNMNFTMPRGSRAVYLGCRLETPKHRIRMIGKEHGQMAQVIVSLYMVSSLEAAQAADKEKRTFCSVGSGIKFQCTDDQYLLYVGSTPTPPEGKVIHIIEVRRFDGRNPDDAAAEDAQVQTQIRPSDSPTPTKQ